MADERPILSLGHSPDPDDAFMWWPVCGLGPAAPAAIDTGPFRYRAEPLDIETLNRRAAERADLDITALSARAYADAAHRYTLTACGASFGDGYGPKVVARPNSAVRSLDDLLRPGVRVAVPGARTTAFLTLSLVLGAPFPYTEMPFDHVMAAVADGRAQAGLIIHEGQLTFRDAGLVEIVDVGRWWKDQTGLPLPLGVNAVSNTLDHRHGPGSTRIVARTLAASVRYAMQHRQTGLDYAARFAMANAGGESATPERIARFVDMYVNHWTADMGDTGRRAIEKLLAQGADRRLCPRMDSINVVSA